MFALAAVSLLTVGVGQAFAQEGQLEVCKNATNGMGGVEFEFTLIEGGPDGDPLDFFVVAGGECTPPMTLPTGTYTVVEGEALDGRVTNVVAISTTFGTLVSRSLAERRITVRVFEDRETLVRFTNRAPPAQIKICKETNSPSFEGALFTFRFLNQAGQQLGSKVAVAANGNCSGLRTFPAGSVITVDEEVPSNAEVTEIRVEGDCQGPLDDPDNLGEDLVEGSVDVRVQSGVCIVTFTNEAVGPAQTGFIEICKNALFVEDEIRENNNGHFDEEVLGESFTFTVSPPGEEPFEVEVLGGQCSEPLQVNAGIVNVQEHPDPRFRVVDIFTRPEEALVSANLVNREADVEVVPTDNPEQETQVHFVNERERGQLKVCKALGPGSTDLIGMEFDFIITDPNDPDDPNDDETRVRTIRAASTTQCIIVGDFPTGDEIEVDEADTDDPTTPSIDEGEFIRETCPTQPITIQPGVNTVTCVNQALGKLQICKELIRERRVIEPDDPSTPQNEEVLEPEPGSPTAFQPTFTFTYQRLTNTTGTGTPTGPRNTVRVRAGTCSRPILVAPGGYRVTEDNPGNNYDVTDIDVIPPENQINENLAQRRTDVIVRFAEDTTVIFENRIRRAFVKVCKEVEPGSATFLNQREFEFTIQTDDGQVDVVNVRPGECSLPQGPYPVLNPNSPTGANNEATVTETEPNDDNKFFVSDIRVQNTRGVTAGGCQGVDDPNTPESERICETFVRFKLAPGVNIVHFENEAVPDP